MTDVEPHKPTHVVLYGIFRWQQRHRHEDTPLPPEVTFPRALREEDGPVGMYPQSLVGTKFRRLVDLGYVETVTYHGKTLGYRITDRGIGLVQELPVPKHYDH